MRIAYAPRTGSKIHLVRGASPVAFCGVDTSDMGHESVPDWLREVALIGHPGVCQRCARGVAYIVAGELT